MQQPISWTMNRGPSFNEMAQFCRPMVNLNVRQIDELMWNWDLGGGGWVEEWNGPHSVGP